MATRVLRAGYFWPTIEADCQDHVRKCKPCQKHDNLIHQKQEQLHHILSPWPFAKWGMDILGPFSPGKGQVKFLIIAVDYFTKWIEAKPLTTITAQQVQQFVWKDIICRYGVPHRVSQILHWPRHQAHHKFCRTSTNQWTSRDGK